MPNLPEYERRDYDFLMLLSIEALRVEAEVINAKVSGWPPIPVNQSKERIAAAIAKWWNSEPR